MINQAKLSRLSSNCRPVKVRIGAECECCHGDADIWIHNGKEYGRPIQIINTLINGKWMEGELTSITMEQAKSDDLFYCSKCYQFLFRENEL